jgi:hypothetical protein
MGAMSGPAKLVTYSAVTLMTLFGVLGGLFAAGYAFQDLPLGTAVGTTAPWLVLGVGLSVFALLSRKVAPPIFVLLTLFVAGQSITDSALGLVDRDEVGPMAAIAVLVLAVGLGFLGLRRTSLAGLLLVLLALAQLAATVVGFRAELEHGEWPGLAHMLTTSSGVVVVPILVVGALYLLAGALEHRSPRFRHPPAHPAPLEP